MARPAWKTVDAKDILKVEIKLSDKYKEHEAAKYPRSAEYTEFMKKAAPGLKGKALRALEWREQQRVKFFKLALKIKHITALAKKMVKLFRERKAAKAAREERASRERLTREDMDQMLAELDEENVEVGEVEETATGSQKSTRNTDVDVVGDSQGDELGLDEENLEQLEYSDDECSDLDESLAKNDPSEELEKIKKEREEDEGRKGGKKEKTPTEKGIPPLVTRETSFRRFCNCEARSRYFGMWNRNVHRERFFAQELAEMPEFAGVLNRSGLGKFEKLTGKGSWELVREVYANMGQRLEEGAKSRKVRIRGQVVDFGGPAIDRFLGQEAWSDKEMAAVTAEMFELNKPFAKEQAGHAFVADFMGVAKDETSIYTKDAKLHVKWSMVPEVKVPILQFILNNITPTQHYTDLSIRFIWLADQLMKGKRVPWGAIISTSIEKIAKTNRTSMSHPLLITAICEECGVNVAGADRKIPPGAPIGMSRKFRAESLNATPVTKRTTPSVKSPRRRRRKRR